MEYNQMLVEGKIYRDSEKLHQVLSMVPCNNVDFFENCGSLLLYSGSLEVDVIVTRKHTRGVFSQLSRAFPGTTLMQAIFSDEGLDLSKVIVDEVEVEKQYYIGQSDR